MKVEKRLLKYIAIKTPCDENSDTVPTSQCQFDLARILADELKELGLARQKSIRSVHQIMTDVISFSETVDGFLQPKISRI